MLSKQIKGGAILSYVTIFLTNVVGLVLTPFIIRSLGASEYGLYTMIGAFVGYLTVLDFGINNSIIRFVAKYRAENDKKGEENFLAISFIIYIFISILVVIFGFLGYQNIDSIFETLTPSELHKAKIMVLILIFNVAITIPGGAFRAMCMGYENFTLPKAVNIYKYIARSILVVFILFYGGDSISLVIIDTIMNLLFIIAMAYIAFGKLKIKVKLYKFEGSLAKSIFNYSIWVFVFALVNKLRWQFGQLILGLNYDTTIVAIYAVGITLGSYYGAFSSAISSLFLPKAMQMTVRSDAPEVLTKTFIRISRLSTYILFFILGGFILVGQQFINLWVGAQFAQAYWYTLLIMIGLTFTLSQSFGNDLLQAKNKHKFRGIVLLLTTLFGVALGWFLSLQYGAMGLIIAIVVFIFFERFVMWWYLSKELKIDMNYYFKNFSSQLIYFLLTVAISYPLLLLIRNHSWLGLLVKISLFAIVYIGFMFKCMNTEERKLVRSLIPKKILA
ncbi:oligosaccharide flippase family protein [Galbibacter sp. BG1]|uniref:lipopolysaccharide biosynthesis protein n=1 Tax=Galbibacter sp. BG1 TaxID=1170699 RepID=UPI0015BB9F05|nr:oligosaccharide flippase family protein [Galbibacter sp. BG1]QLE02794.1 oligosaccharide flippase family protein [Galbibacter sp. BG1]